jgi:hypothetical protein
LRSREDYIHLVEVSYFGAKQGGHSKAVLARFATGALLTGYAGDAPARVLARLPGPGQESLDAFMAAVRDFDLTYLDFVHTVDTQAQRASTFTLIMRPKPEGPLRHVPERRLRDCNFFQFNKSHLINVVAQFCRSGLTTLRKLFFSEEKKQKTFMSLSRFYPAACARERKVFWFFFSKKNFFSSSLTPQTGTSLPTGTNNAADATPPNVLRSVRQVLKVQAPDHRRR